MEALIQRLADLLVEAKTFEQQSETLEALCCYDSILKDPSISAEPDILRRAASGMAKVLRSEAGRSVDSVRTRRLIERAIGVLDFARNHAPREPADTLALIELHATHHDHFADPKHLLAANLIMEGFVESGDLVEVPHLSDACTALRARITRRR